MGNGDHCMGKNTQQTNVPLFQRATGRWEGLCRAIWRALREPHRVRYTSGEHRSHNDMADWLGSLQNTLRSRQWQGPLTPIEIEAVQKDLLTLQRGLTGNRDLVGRSYMQERALLGSYLLFYWFISRAQVEGMLNMVEARKAWENEATSGNILKTVPSEPIRILDVGAGPAPGSIAVADWLRSRGSDTPIHITACDRSSEAVEIGAFLAQQAGYTYQGVPLWKAGEDPLPQGQYDVVFLGHVLNELWPDREDRIDRRFAFLMGVLSLLRGGGLLIILEPATMTSSREALALRDRLLTIDTLEIWAPCFYTASCPALTGSNQTCHSHFRSFLPSTTRLLAQRLGLNKDLIKTTAFVFQKKELLLDDGKDLFPDTVTAIKKGATGKEATQIPDPGAPPLPTTTKDPTLLGPFRVVSEPMLNKAGRTRFILCGPSGRVAFSAKRGEGYPAEKPFFSLDRSDSILIVNPMQRDQGLALGAETKILNIAKDSIA
ncbi:small ribosomal subunit Rsm22 family protein [Treponema sp. J25]|uniref:small ribosomal subunit Rsm22 family protein n=1 Tax=Treponema sp. J25 TaxID=2094121 RepID=UPI001AA0099C|nr:small ribosomal subunit Rsm22 family protein [Treponema sp. J25]